MDRIVLASTNKGKLREFGDAFKILGIEVVSISQYIPMWDVEENGTTFFANAQIKAEAAMTLTGLPALADDSGLSVYYMGGAPG
ncbi:MAG: non-canonical purine NTP pyrophosphatase, partial [Bacillota bacterium]|nr:non-canonical purine NTP pyrophosphatase [Bacillota bacterium]